MTVRITPPPRIARLQNQVRERDREYFEQHPAATEYVRPYVPGEVWPVDYAAATHVIVTQIVPGFRTKAFIVRKKTGGAKA